MEEVNLTNQTGNSITLLFCKAINFVSLLFTKNINKMENKDLQFKTNINCGGCVASVKPHLDNAEGICEWNVDTTNKDKVLTVKSEGITQEQVLEIIRKTGFKAEPLG